ncbi:UbiA-domain-containing protein [Xylariaceae sp. FL1651]|nr:UbiA-domain-containing protein [Xylariaceae sp. FL1651]
MGGATNSKSPNQKDKKRVERLNYFPHLPPYSDPTTGFISRLPRSWIPYAQLMRIERPGGLYAFYFPYLIGLMYSACIAPSPPEPQTLLYLALVLLPFNVVLRGASCTWNDTVDQEFDRRVTRCRHRPVARGAVSTTAANCFTALQLAVLYPATVMLFPPACAPHMLVAVLLFCVYALMKRVTYYPQVVLGIPFAWAVFFCATIMGMEPFPLSVSSFLGQVTELQQGRGVNIAPKNKATLALFGANVLWTIIYDTIYAFQDVTDDAKAGVKSMALRFRHSAKILASVLAVAQVSLLALCGIWAEFGVLYFVGTVGSVAVTMAYYICDVDLESSESCGTWFHDQFWIVGAAFMTGLISEYATRLTG